MITCQEGNTCFNYRVVGVALHEDRVLLQTTPDVDFWFLPGGRAELLEPATEALKREMREELGVEVQVGRLIWVVENFFEMDGKDHHELSLYFLMSFAPASPLYGKIGPFNGDEEGLVLICQWFPLDQLENTRLYPSFLRQALNAIPSGIEHIVHRDS
jgi:ADP-ribose pyrophosphatase YjhB (NUDIX family)